MGGKAGREKEATLSFGFREVAEGEKQQLVNEVFARVAARYDQMNDLMSGGLHRLWKDDFVAALNPPRQGRFDVLDVAGGTGDIAFRILERGGPGVHVTLADISPEMVMEGRRRALAEQRPRERLSFMVANAEALPFPDDCFDAYTIAFGIRNVPHVDRALSEAWRVLRPGGRFMCLEFSQLAVPYLSDLYDAYSFTVIPAMGRAVTGDGAPYRYLVESIRRFPNQETFRRMIEEAGFERVQYRNMTGGVVAMHWGWKI
jgi:demethylmenaquinone methyltransferase/2-methoxy-6-polyprenyl-1,4-benzoquinol methylase